MRRALCRLGLAIAIAGCSTAPAGTPAPRTGAPLPATPAASTGASTAPSASSAIAASPGTSLVPVESAGGTGAPPTAPPSAPAAARWQTIAPPLAVPAAYLDFGFAGDGDLLVVGTDLITDPKLALWIARYRTDGTRVSKQAVDRRVGFLNADWIDFDPSNDTVVFLETQSDGTFITRRVSSSTGRTVASIELHRAVIRIAIDEGGRMFATSPTYSTSNTRRPCLVDLLGAGGGIAGGVDGFLEPCETRFVVRGPFRFTAPYEVTVARSGHLVFVDEDRDETGRWVGLRIVVVTRAWSFVRAWDLPFEWKSTDPAYGVIFSSFSLAASGVDEVYIGETLATADGSRSDGYRIRHFGPNGGLLETLGKGGDQDGITWPSHPAVDSADRLWVIDLDIETRSYSIKVRT